MKILFRKRGRALRVGIIVLFIVTALVINFKGYFITAFSPMINLAVKYRVLSNVKDYEEIETENFIIRYKEGDLDSALMTKEIAERHYYSVTSMLNHFPSEKTNIIIYNSGNDLLENLDMNKETPPLGVYYGGVINVLSPQQWINDKDNMKNIYEKDGPIVHEFAHLIVDQKTKGNYPMWLTEGVALYTEYKITGFEWGRNKTYEEDVSIEVLDKNFYGIDQGLAYRKSFEVVRDISDAWGFNKMLLILNQLGEGNNLVGSTRTVLKVNLEDID